MNNISGIPVDFPETTMSSKINDILHDIQGAPKVSEHTFLVISLFRVINAL
jgi:hypothetical protein